MDVTLVQTAVRWLHLLATISWLGGSIFITAVLAPILRRTMSPVERVVLVDTVGNSFSVIAWSAIAVLLITGVVNAFFRLGSIEGILAGLAAPGYGRVLLLKLILVGGVVLLTALHSFLWGPRLGRMAKEARDGALSVEFARLRRTIALWSAVTLLGNLTIVALAAYMVALRS